MSRSRPDFNHHQASPHWLLAARPPLSAAATSRLDYTSSSTTSSSSFAHSPLRQRVRLLSVLCGNNLTTLPLPPSPPCTCTISLPIYPQGLYQYPPHRSRIGPRAPLSAGLAIALLFSPGTMRSCVRTQAARFLCDEPSMLTLPAEDGVLSRTGLASGRPIQLQPSLAAPAKPEPMECKHAWERRRAGSHAEEVHHQHRADVVAHWAAAATGSRRRYATVGKCAEFSSYAELQMCERTRVVASVGKR